MNAKIPVNRFAAFTAAGSDLTVYKVSSNRKFTITDIVITNKETGTILVTLWDGSSAGGDKKIEIKVPGDSTKSILKIGNGPQFRTSVVAQVDSYTDGSSINIGGYEE